MKFASVVKTGLFKGPVDFLLIDQFLIEKIKGAVFGI